MANNDEKVSINRSYTDNFDVKAYTSDVLIPKYFKGDGISQRTVGLLGLTTEQISNIAEDVFNTGSVYVRETFPNRSMIPESIYSQAAIFGLTNIFSTPNQCDFILVLDEATIIENLKWEDGIGYFYVDKNTIINVEGIDFSLDYDIMIKAIKRYENDKDNSLTYLFSASYMMNGQMINMINPNQNPYIPAKRSADGYLALAIITHQYVREVKYETILDNAKINSPTIDINYEGQLAGFDIMYKTAEETEYTTQLEKKVKYSTPSVKPFCYFSRLNEGILRITFNTKDLYFMPEFNSSVKITLYLTQGSGGKFAKYTGNNISINQVPERYAYDKQYIMAAKPLSGSYGGTDELPIQSLQRLTVEGYRTALALTTESDLNEFFSNYPIKYGHNNAVKFLKRRNDVAERVYGGVVAIKDANTLYKTNTLNVSMNLGDMLNPEPNLYTIEPGVVFKYRPGAKNNTDPVQLYYDETIRNKQIIEYNEAVEKLKAIRTSVHYVDKETNEPISYTIWEDYGLESRDYFIPYYTKERDMYYIRNEDKYEAFYADGKDKDKKASADIDTESFRLAVKNGEIIDELTPILDVLYAQRGRKEQPSYLQMKLVPLSTWIQRQGSTTQMFLFDITDEKLDEYDDKRSSISNPEMRHEWYRNLPSKYLFVNPFLIRFLKNPNSVNMYLTYVDQDVTFDFTSQNDKSFLQFVSVKMNVKRSFEETKRYKLRLVLEPNINTSIQTTPLLKTLKGYRNLTDNSYYQETIMGLYDLYNEDDELQREDLLPRDVIEHRIIGEKIWSYAKDPRYYYRQENNKFILFKNRALVTNVDTEKPAGIKLNPTVEEMTRMMNSYIVRETTTQLDPEWCYLKEDPSLLKYATGDNVDVTENSLRVIGCIKSKYDEPRCFVEFKPVDYDDSTCSFTFEAEFYTDDHITVDGELRLLTESKFYDRRTGYTYYSSTYPEKITGGNIYDDITDPVQLKDMIPFSSLESGYVLVTDYESLEDFIVDQNKVEGQEIYHGFHDGTHELPVLDDTTNDPSVIREAVKNNPDACYAYLFIDKPDKETIWRSINASRDYYRETTKGYVLYRASGEIATSENGTDELSLNIDKSTLDKMVDQSELVKETLYNASAHRLYMVYKIKFNDKILIRACYVGIGYNSIGNETCYPEYYLRSDGDYNKYAIDDQGKYHLMSDSQHPDAVISKEEVEKMYSNKLLEKHEIDINPEWGNYYMISQTRKGYYNYYRRGNDGDYHIERDENGYPIEYSKDSIPSFDMLIEEAHLHNMSGAQDIRVPIDDLNCEIQMLTNYTYKTSDDVIGPTIVKASEEDTDNIFFKFDPSLRTFIWTNKYSTLTDGVTLVKPLTSCRVNVDFEDWRYEDHDILDIMMYSVPFIKWDIAKDPQRFSYFIRNFTEEYDVLTSIINTRLKNLTDLDIKLYNTYGLATNFIVGEEGEKEARLDTLNLFLEFDIWFNDGIDLGTAIMEVKQFIKDEVEKINDDGLNNLFISNLMRKMEIRFEYISHIRFVRINDYDPDVQTVRNEYVDLEEIPDKETRRLYIPEILTIDIDNIVINDHIV